MNYFGYGLAALILIGLIVLAWRLWGAYTQRTAEEEEYERNVASLNDQQANRMSDGQIRRPIDIDTGWDVMVQRGKPERRRRRRRR
ncbi:MAG: hypothetical protein HC822_16925 [Oscillochloris sp.]|nr:hypothetical protein [Oscillochloris sp.]